MDSKPEIHISKIISLADEPVDIVITGLQKNQKITFHGSSTLSKGEVFESLAHYVAGEEGRVLLNTNKSLGGTYEGIDPMGPFWSLIPSPFNKRNHERFLVKDPSKPFLVRLRVYDSFLTLEDIKNSSESYMSSLEVMRTYSAPGVRYEEVRVGRVRGYLFLPPGEGPYPGVISMSGGYPGAMKYKGALLASHGYATLALKYFGEDDLPEHIFHIDITYIEEAAVFLKNHPEVSGEGGVGMVANCFGASLALCIAGCGAPGLINCVVSISGWCFSFWETSYGDRIWPRMRDCDVEFEAKSDGSLRQYYKLAYSDPWDEKWSPHLFDFHKRRDIPYLFIWGGEDASFNTRSASSFFKILLEKEGHNNYEAVFYPGAGHLIEHAYNPLGRVAFTIDGHLYYGGKQPQHERAQQDSWRKILTFLERNLSQSKMSRL